MARRLEWQPVAAQGLNPIGALGTSVSAFQGAAGTAQSLRDNERANETLIQNSYSDLIKSHLGAGELEVKQQAEARKAKEEASFNPAEVERLFTDHFIAGGTPENFVDNPEVMGLIDEYGDSVFNHGIQTFNRFNKSIDDEVSKLSGMAETTRAAKILEIDALDADESTKTRLKSEVENEYVNTLAGIQASAFENFANLRQSRNRYLGLEPAGATTEGGAPSTVERQAAKSNDFNDYMSQLQSDYVVETDRIDQEHLDGLINDAEYSRQRAEAEENYNQQLRNLGKDDRRYNITSSTGERLTFDYTDLPNGGIQVGNRELPMEVSDALRFAVDSFDVPMEAMLAFSTQESSLNPSAVSDKGVVGLMQVTKPTGREMFEKHRELFESYGITEDNIDDRDNPLVSAMTGAAYLAHIRDDILHGDAPFEQVYVAYNIGPNNALVKQFHNRNVPIDKLPGVNVNGVPIQNNIDMYYDKRRDAWRTPAEISALIRDRMNLVPAGDDPVSAISQVAQAESGETSIEPVVSTELIEAEANNGFHQIDLNRDPVGELDRVLGVANSVIPMKTLGADGKLGAQISAPEYADMLTVMGVDPDPKRIKQLRELVVTHDVLPTLPAEEVSNILSFAVKNAWGGGIDEASTLENINGVLDSWDSHREKIRAQMASADNLKRYATAYTEARERLQGRISELEGRLGRYENRQLTSLEERAREDTANLLVGAQRELASATSMYQGRMQEDYEKILRFRQELEATRVNKSSADAQAVIDELRGRERRGARFNPTTASRQDLERLTKDMEDPLFAYIRSQTTP